MGGGGSGGRKLVIGGRLAAVAVGGRGLNRCRPVVIVDVLPNVIGEVGILNYVGAV